MIFVLSHALFLFKISLENHIKKPLQILETALRILILKVAIRCNALIIFLQFLKDISITNQRFAKDLQFQILKNYLDFLIFLTALSKPLSLFHKLKG